MNFLPGETQATIHLHDKLPFLCGQLTCLSFSSVPLPLPCCADNEEEVPSPLVEILFSALYSFWCLCAKIEEIKCLHFSSIEPFPLHFFLIFDASGSLLELASRRTTQNRSLLGQAFLDNKYLFIIKCAC